MITKILTVIGLRSQCCGAKIETWHAGKDLCVGCQRWLYKDVTAVARPVLTVAPTPAFLNLKRLK